MRANELRIGNLILTPSGHTDTIESQDFQEVKGLCNIEMYKPIPLTEEWLLKFGFYDVGNNWFEKDDFPLIIGFNTDNALVSMEFMLSGKDKYVHHLQNLYFALTGKELTLNAEQ